MGVVGVCSIGGEASPGATTISVCIGEAGTVIVTKMSSFGKIKFENHLNLEIKKTFLVPSVWLLIFWMLSSTCPFSFSF